MDKRNKFGCGIMIGGLAWILITYGLISVVGENPLINLFVIIGWIILAILVVKYIKLEKQNDSDKTF